MAVPGVPVSDETWPHSVTLRILLLDISVTYSAPVRSKAMPRGMLKRAFVPSPSLEPVVPDEVLTGLPASVVHPPAGVMTRTFCAETSVTYRTPVIGCTAIA